MKTHSNNFKNQLKEYGREFDDVITYGGNTLGKEDINSVKLSYDSGLLKSQMKTLVVDSNVEISKGTSINYQLGLKVGNSYEYLDYGNFIVEKVEQQKDKKSYLITCYDKMLYSMKDYESLGVTYPITIRNYLSAICTKLGLTFHNSSDTFTNYDKTITEEHYLDTDGNSLGYTFRDVLDDLAECVGGFIIINSSDELEIKYINTLLPDGYKQVEYIDKSATNQRTCYIDTLLYPNQIEKVEMDLSFDAMSQSGGSYAIGGYYSMAQSGTATHFSHLVLNSSNKIGYGYGASWVYSNTSWNIGERHKITSVLKKGLQELLVDGTSIIKNSNQYEPTNANVTVPLFVYQYQNNRYGAYGWSGKIYSIKMYNSSNELIRDFIPCYRVSDNVIGMYDLVNDTFYTNSGTGTFTCGEIKQDGIDTINEEYFNDKNVNIGQKYGAINTIVLSRAEADNLYYPSTLPQNPIELKINDNPILEQTNRDTYIQGIYNKLNGLEFYLNDFQTNGILYYELGDLYNVSIDNTIYPCLMLNDDIKRTTGLKENIYTKEPQNSVTEYKYASSSDKAEITGRNAYIIANKAEGTASMIATNVGQNGVVTSATIMASINNDTSQAKINADKVDIEASDVLDILSGNQINLTSKNISIASTNFSVDSSGNVACNNIDINGGYVTLIDNPNDTEDRLIIWASDRSRLMSATSEYVIVRDWDDNNPNSTNYSYAQMKKDSGFSWKEVVDSNNSTSGSCRQDMLTLRNVTNGVTTTSQYRSDGATINGNTTINGVITINNPDNNYTGLNINASNTNEASIKYRNNADTKGYAAGYGTLNYDGFGIFSQETSQNVFTIDKNGNTNIVGNISSNNLSSNNLKTEINGQGLIDYQTLTYQTRPNSAYLFFNTHIFSRCMCMITVYNYNTVNVDTIFASTPSAVPTITINDGVLTIQANGNCRGWLVDLTNFTSA